METQTMVWKRVEKRWEKGGKKVKIDLKGGNKVKTHDAEWKRSGKQVENSCALNVSPLQGSRGGGKKVENRWNQVPP